MSLKDNIQGQEDQRLEDANNPSGILRVSPMESNIQPELSGKTTLLGKTQISEKIIQLEIDAGYDYNDDTRLFDNSEYGDLIIPYEFLRVFDTVSGKWIDIKITKILDIVGTPDHIEEGSNYTATLEGILVNGTFDDIVVGDEVRWSTYAQKEIDKRAPNNLFVGDITDTSITFTWNDPTPDDGAIAKKVQWRKWGDDNWQSSDVGNWVTDLKIGLEGARWPMPTETFSDGSYPDFVGKKVYWIEFSKPEVLLGHKAEGWIEIIDGNYGSTLITDYGSGYLDVPKYKLYYRRLPDNRVVNPVILKNTASTLRITTATPHPFVAGDVISVRFKFYPQLNGDYPVTIVNATKFEISPNNIDDFPSLYSGDHISTFELAPVKVPEKPGVIIPILSKDKYYIQDLLPKSTYEISVVSYFTKDLKDYSDYAPCINFTTR